jgi:hypothetical protein
MSALELVSAKPSESGRSSQKMAAAITGGAGYGKEEHKFCEKARQKKRADAIARLELLRSILENRHGRVI